MSLIPQKGHYLWIILAPASPILTQSRYELSGARIAGAAVITRIWAALSSGLILFLLSMATSTAADLMSNSHWSHEGTGGCQLNLFFKNEIVSLTSSYCLYPVWRRWMLWVRGSREAQGRCPVMPVLSHKSLQCPGGWLCDFGDVTREVKAIFGASVIHTLCQAARLPGFLLWVPGTWLIS